MSKADEERASGIPTRVIHNAYVQTKNARHQYIHARKNDSGIEAARRELQQAVLNYYEVLREYIQKHLDDFWHGKLPHDGSDGIAIFGYSDTTTTAPFSEFTPTGGLKDDAAILNELRDNQRILGVTDINEDAGVVTIQIRTYQAGLKHLDHLFDETQTQYDQKKGSPLGNRVVRKQTSQQLNTGLLFTAARCLDQATMELGLLAAVDEGTPRTQITEETLEEVKAWREQNIE